MIAVQQCKSRGKGAFLLALATTDEIMSHVACMWLKKRVQVCRGLVDGIVWRGSIVSSAKLQFVWTILTVVKNLTNSLSLQSDLRSGVSSSRLELKRIVQWQSENRWELLE